MLYLKKSTTKIIDSRRLRCRHLQIFHVFYVAKNVINSDGQKPWTFLGNIIKPIIVEGCFDVHTEEDLIKTEKWLNENNNI